MNVWPGSRTLEYLETDKKVQVDLISGSEMTTTSGGMQIHGLNVIEKQPRAQGKK